jgi:hypothetical protein
MIDRKVSWNGKEYAWKDHPGDAFVLDMVHVSALVSRPAPLIKADEDVFNERSSTLQKPVEYWLVTLTTMTVPGRIADFMLPDNYSSSAAAMDIAEKHLLRERQRALDLFGVADEPLPPVTEEEEEEAVPEVLPVISHE